MHHLYHHRVHLPSITLPLISLHFCPNLFALLALGVNRYLSPSRPTTLSIHFPFLRYAYGDLCFLFHAETPFSLILPVRTFGAYSGVLHNSLISSLLLLVLAFMGTLLVRTMYVARVMPRDRVGQCKLSL